MIIICVKSPTLCYPIRFNNKMNKEKHKKTFRVWLNETTIIVVRSKAKALLWIKRYPDAKLVG